MHQERARMSTTQAQPTTAKFSPGFGKKRKKYEPKGRQVDPEILADITALLAGRNLEQRDLLIEHLHIIQDHYGHISAGHIAALARLMRLSQTEVYEVATFYAHFDVIGDDQTPPPPITVRVCDSLSCMMAGAETLIDTLAHDENADVRILRAPCMGRCQSAPVAEVGHRFVDHADASSVQQTIEAGDFHPEIPDYQSFQAYQDDGGYHTLRACLNGDQTVDTMIDTLQDAQLRGLGGAGFPSAKKWSIVRSFEGPRLMAVNADEGEPGTFKDRHYLETNPHQFLEGMLIAAWAVEATTVYVYLRDEYPAVREILQKEIQAIQAAGLASHTTIDLRRGAGAYICGEESAMIESIEGKRGLPRHKPPFVAELGIHQRPTLVHNVETLYWLPKIFTHGAHWFSQHGRHGGVGLRSFSVSGRVKSPGVKLAPAGITLQELIDEYCDGMLDGHTLKGYLPGGASGGILPASMADLPLEFGQLEAHGSFVGSHAVVVLSDQDDMREVALNLMKFFEDESCGQCTPCRVGTQKAVALMQQPSWNTDQMQILSDTMRDASICGLGQAAGNPLNAIMRYFPDELASAQSNQS